LVLPKISNNQEIFEYFGKEKHVVIRPLVIWNMRGLHGKPTSTCKLFAGFL